MEMDQLSFQSNGTEDSKEQEYREDMQSRNLFKRPGLDGYRADVPLLVCEKGGGPSVGGRALSTSLTRYKHRSWGPPPPVGTLSASKARSHLVGPSIHYGGNVYK